MANPHPNTSGLKKFKAGAEWTGNASGRPKKRPITDEYFQILNEPIPEKLRKAINAQLGVDLLPNGATWARAQAIRRVMDSLEVGGYQSSKEMREAIEGKAPLRLEIQGVQRQETTLRVIFEKKDIEHPVVQRIQIPD